MGKKVSGLGLVCVVSLLVFAAGCASAGTGTSFRAKYARTDLALGFIQQNQPAEVITGDEVSLTSTVSSKQVGADFKQKVLGALAHLKDTGTGAQVSKLITAGGAQAGGFQVSLTTECVRVTQTFAKTAVSFSAAENAVSMVLPGALAVLPAADARSGSSSADIVPLGNSGWVLYHGRILVTTWLSGDKSASCRLTRIMPASD